MQTVLDKHLYNFTNDELKTKWGLLSYAREIYHHMNSKYDDLDNKNKKFFDKMRQEQQEFQSYYDEYKGHIELLINDKDFNQYEQ